MVDTIKTATGKQFSSDYVVTNDAVGQLYIRIFNSNYMELAQIFSNPSETIQLLYGLDYYANYTKLIAIIPEGPAFKIMLEKEG